MATRGSVSPNSVRYHRRLDRFPEKHTDKLNLADRQTLYEIRSVMEKKLMQMNELKDKLEDSEKCLEEERERRRRVEEHLQLVDLYSNPAINAELRQRLPRASKVDPLCSVTDSGIQDSTGRLKKVDGDDRMMWEDGECMLPVADSHLTHTGDGEMQEGAVNHLNPNEGNMMKIPDEPLALDDGSTFQEDGDHLTHDNDDDGTLQSVHEHLMHDHDNMLKDFDPLYCNGDSTLLSVCDLTLGANSTLHATDDKLTLGNSSLQVTDKLTLGNSTQQVTDDKLTLGNSTQQVTDGKLTLGNSSLQVIDDKLTLGNSTQQVTDGKLTLANSTQKVTDDILTLGNSSLETADAELARNGNKYRETSDSFGINTEDKILETKLN